MGKKSMKRPEYDGNACMLYDFMGGQKLEGIPSAELIEELKRRGYKVYKEV